MIRHLRHGDIDKAAWDAMLVRCANRLWYAQSWVLDRMSPGWEALVDEATGALMPLTHRRKAGIDYLFQPLGLQQLGVFSPQPGAEAHDRFLEAIPERFRYIDIALNEAMQGLEQRDGVSAFINQLIQLDAPAEVLRERYDQGHRRNLRRTSVDLVPGAVGPEAFEALFRATTGRRFGPSAVKGLHAFIRTVADGIDRGQCALEGRYQGDELVAAICTASWEGRIILLKSAATERGQAARAMFHFYDALIARHAGHGSLLDLAGSMTPGVARFNAGFGARATTYFRLRRNRLPLPLRWIKR